VRKKTLTPIRRRAAPPAPRTAGNLPGHEVILDVIFEEGLLFLAVRNLGVAPAVNVSMKFDRAIHGVNGSKEVSALPLFRHIAFLAPQKEIRTFLDTSASYFSRNEPTRFSVAINYEDLLGRAAAYSLTHDLEIYREIGYVRREGPQRGRRTP
jgi:hypothetical protein